jgi:hypothetical protein
MLSFYGLTPCDVRLLWWLLISARITTCGWIDKPENFPTINTVGSSKTARHEHDNPCEWGLN